MADPKLSQTLLKALDSAVKTIKTTPSTGSDAATTENTTGTSNTAAKGTATPKTGDKKPIDPSAPTVENTKDGHQRSPEQMARELAKEQTLVEKKQETAKKENPFKGTTIQGICATLEEMAREVKEGLKDAKPTPQDQDKSRQKMADNQRAKEKQEVIERDPKKSGG